MSSPFLIFSRLFACLVFVDSTVPQSFDSSLQDTRETFFVIGMFGFALSMQFAFYGAHFCTVPQ